MTYSPKLDHLLYAAPDLDEAAAQLEGVFGVRLKAGGRHPGLGTRNALMSLGGKVYLELLAPDPEQAADAPMGAALRQITRPGLITWCAIEPDLTGFAKAAPKGVQITGPHPASRSTPEGALLTWRLLHLSGHDFGALVPFFIDWENTPHPTSHLAPDSQLESFTLSHPAPSSLRSFLDSVYLRNLDIREGEPGLACAVKAPKGSVTLPPAQGFRPPVGAR